MTNKLEIEIAGRWVAPLAHKVPDELCDEITLEIDGDEQHPAWRAIRTAKLSQTFRLRLGGQEGSYYASMSREPLLKVERTPYYEATFIRID